MIDISGTKISVVVGKVIKELDLADIFSIDETELTREYSQQASLYAYFSTLTADAERNVAMATMIMEQEYAIMDQEYRSDAVADDVKVTESMVKQAIISDKDYQKLSKNVINKKYYFRVLKAVADALEQRANMLVSLGAYLRHEQDMTGMNIRRREFDNSVDNMKSTIKKIRREYEDESVSK